MLRGSTHEVPFAHHVGLVTKGLKRVLHEWEVRGQATVLKCTEEDVLVVGWGDGWVG